MDILHIATSETGACAPIYLIREDAKSGTAYSVYFDTGTRREHENCYAEYVDAKRCFDERCRYWRAKEV